MPWRSGVTLRGRPGDCAEMAAELRSVGAARRKAFQIRVLAGSNAPVSPSAGVNSGPAGRSRRRRDSGCRVEFLPRIFPASRTRAYNHVVPPRIHRSALPARRGRCLLISAVTHAGLEGAAENGFPHGPASGIPASAKRLAGNCQTSVEPVACLCGTEDMTGDWPEAGRRVAFASRLSHRPGLRAGERWPWKRRRFA